MSKKKKLTSAKRFGARYGTRGKLKFDEIEQKQRSLHKCPECSQKKVKRESTGIWKCRKCGAKFASGAYEVKKAEERSIKVEEESEE